MSTTETVKTAMHNAIAVANSATGNTDSNVTDAIQSLVSELNSAREEGGGISLPTLTNPATDEDVTAGKEYVGGNGAKRTGTSTAKEDLASANSDIASTINAVAIALGTSADGYSTALSAANAAIAQIGQGGSDTSVTEITVVQPCANANEVAAALSAFIPGWNTLYSTTAIFRNKKTFDELAPNEISFAVVTGRGTSYSGIWNRKNNDTTIYEASSFAAVYTNTNILSGTTFEMVTLSPIRPPER